MVDELKENFPRHFREQARQIIQLRRKFDRQLIQQAVARILEHRCVSYRNLKKTVRYLASQQTRKEAFQTGLDLPAELPPDLGLETRRSSYYDELLEVES